MKFLLLAIFHALSIATANAQSGGGNGGGPDERFKFRRDQLAAWVLGNDDASLDRKLHLTQNQVDPKSFRKKLLEKMKINPVFKPSWSKSASLRYCSNFSNTLSIECYFYPWMFAEHMGLDADLYVIVLHEYLGLLNIEMDDATHSSRYPVSSHLYKIYPEISGVQSSLPPHGTIRKRTVKASNAYRCADGLVMNALFDQGDITRISVSARVRSVTVAGVPDEETLHTLVAVEGPGGTARVEVSGSFQSTKYAGMKIYFDGIAFVHFESGNSGTQCQFVSTISGRALLHLWSASRSWSVFQSQEPELDSASLILNPFLLQ